MQTTRIIAFIFLLMGVFLLALSCGDQYPEERDPKRRDLVVGTDSKTGWPIVKKDKLLVVEPYLDNNCGCFHRQPCLIINGKKECESIRGYKHKEGVRTRLLVDVYKRPDNIMDVGQFGYILKEILEEN